MWRPSALLLCATLLLVCTQALQPSGTEAAPAAHFEPQVAVLCEKGAGAAQYHSQYMGEAGRWLPDTASKPASCRKDKLEILEYCKKVYPKRDITNIVEASHYQRISNWCRVGHKKCKSSHYEWVKPYRCLEGPFQSDALLVPENCLFDHIHNQTKCWQFDRWNATAADSCRDRGLALRSFAMLLPCGISLFSGVEFVCCPKHFKDNGKMKKPLELAVAAAALKGKEQKILEAAQQQQMVQQQPPQLPEEDDEEDDDDEEEDELPEDELNEDDEDEDADQEQDQEQQEQDDAATDEEDETEEGAGDDYDDDDEEDDGTADKEQDASSAAPAAAALPSPTAAPATASGVGQAATPVPTPDPYFTHFDPRIEHQAYKDAQQRLEEQHREKVTKVMKDWSDLEERYQDMRASDPRAADDFKRRMTQRFQMTVQALEEEGDAEKHQLVAMHQQRVAAHIKERKKDAMSCYTRALSDSPPNTHRVQKCLQKLLRALHKDRHHTISHYRHLLVSSFEQAEREKAATLEHLTEIDRTVNQSLQMLERYPELRTKIGQLMEDYIQALRSKDETPGSLLAMTRDAEAAILEKYRADVAAKQEEKERQRQLEKQRKEQRKKERAELSRQQQQQQQQDAPAEAAVIPAEEDAAVAAVAPQPAVQAQVGQQAPPVQPAAYSSAAPPESETAAVHHQEEPPARVAHAQTHDVSHSEATFSVRREVYHRENKSIYFTLAFAGITLMAAVIVGIAVLRRRSARSPQNQGFVEVDQAATPEERHVANMQINGYENPTYKYFEVKE